jgi:cellulose synthase/poly-beta-1,6-N-acetylglucosamine synthase-like glycosyltransferase
MEQALPFVGITSHDRRRNIAVRNIHPVGVIIPTFNRSDILLRCLQHLEVQAWKKFDVIVVDDGSTDDTSLQMESYAARTSLSFQYVRQENSGPARARNRAISLLQSPVCLMIGDDILASPDLVQIHLSLHLGRPDSKVVGLGFTRWSESGQVVTPFMQWLDRAGVQFAYGDLVNGTIPSWKHFYTSNLSMKTEHLRRHPFHESFHKAAMEDLELGYRMEKQDALEVVFLPNAIAEHLHPTSVVQACRRMIAVGAAAHLFGELWPEHKERASTSMLKERIRSVLLEKRWVLPRLRDAASLLTRFWCPNPLLEKVLLLHHTLGYREAAARKEQIPMIQKS